MPLWTYMYYEWKSILLLNHLLICKPQLFVMTEELIVFAIGMALQLLFKLKECEKKGTNNLCKHISYTRGSIQWWNHMHHWKHAKVVLKLGCYRWRMHIALTVGATPWTKTYSLKQCNDIQVSLQSWLLNISDNYSDNVSRLENNTSSVCAFTPTRTYKVNWTSTTFSAYNDLHHQLSVFF